MKILIYDHNPAMAEGVDFIFILKDRIELLSLSQMHCAWNIEQHIKKKECYTSFPSECLTDLKFSWLKSRIESSSVYEVIPEKYLRLITSDLQFHYWVTKEQKRYSYLFEDVIL